MRLKVIKIIYLTAFLIITVRLFYWQIIKTDELTARAEGQRFLTKEVKPTRGSILFADSSVLAGSKPSYLVFTQPKLIDETLLKAKNITDLDNPQKNIDHTQVINFKKDYARKLAVVFHQENKKQATQTATIPATPEEEEIQIKQIEENLFSKINKNLFWVNLNFNVDLEIKKGLEGLDLAGLGFEEDSTRFYPEGSSSAHLLGFVGSNEYGESTGYFGLEGFYNGELRGKKGTMTQEKDALGLPILIGDFFSRQPKSGKTLVLNIDRAVQRIVERSLQKGLEKYKAKSVSAVIVDPSTGAVLAMASYPSYDPSKNSQYPREFLRNPVTADAYEPGSTFKVLVMAAGINEKVIESDTKCDICSGPLKVADYTIRTWNNKYQENPSMSDVIIHSDNTGMVFVSRKLGLEKMYDYIKKFGFGELTNIDVQDEASPDIRPVKNWKEIDLATSSFGQGISVTPIQIVRAVATIANGGNLYEPHVVSKIIDGDKTHTVQPRIISTPISPEAAKVITEMMVKAVDQGESQFYKKSLGISNYKIAGKTGTAQIPVAGHYDPTKTVASFVGFAPADNPKFVMLVRYNEPGTSIYGADTAAPTFFEIAKELFLYYGIAPTESIITEKR